MHSTIARADPVLAFHFSTDDFAESERATAWQELFGRRLLEIDIEPLPARRLYCNVRLHALPGVAVLFGRGSEARFARTKGQINSDDFTFAICDSGRWHASQRGREATLGAGEAILIAKSDVVMMTMSAWEGTMFRVPADAIAPLVPDIYAVVAQPVPANSPALQLLVRYLGLFRDTPALATAELCRPFATHVHDLLAVALGTTRDAAEIAKHRGVRAARVQAIVAEIRQGFADPRFSPAAIAGKVGLSPRSVQDLLQETGLPFTERVIALRLERARALLEAPANGQRKIIDIAYSCGFNDLSYFNRCFRRRFGATPAQCRGAKINETEPASCL